MSKCAKIAILAAIILLGIVSSASGLVLDNSGGGVWQKVDVFPLASTTTNSAQYCIVINGNWINITNSQGVIKTSLYDADFWNYVNASGADIRIANQTSEQYFWIEEFNAATKTAKIWVNLSAGSSVLLIYYGNPFATQSSYENGNKTFDFFDDFNETTLNTVKWPYERGTFGVSNGYLVLATDAGTSPGNWLRSSYYGTQYVAYMRVILEGDAGFLIHAQGTATQYSATGDMGRGYAATEGYININEWSGSAWGTATITYSTAIQNGKTYILKTVVDKNSVDLSVGSLSISRTVTYGSGYFGIHYAVGALSKIDWVIVASLSDPATFATPYSQVARLSAIIPVPASMVRVVYNAYNITGELMVNNSTTLLTPIFTYVPSNLSSTGYLATGSTIVPSAANITIYLDSNTTLNEVICNGTVVTPLYQGTYTSPSGEIYNVYNFTSPSAGVLIITANVTPIRLYYNNSMLYLTDTPTLKIQQLDAINSVNSTYGANITMYVNTKTQLVNVIYNGTSILSNLTLIGSSEIQNQTYNIYNYTTYEDGLINITTSLPNLAYNTTIYADGETNFTESVVGEPILVKLPVKGDVIINGSAYYSILQLSTKFMHPGTASILIKINNTTNMQFGVHKIYVPVVWGYINLTEIGYNNNTLTLSTFIYNVNYSIASSNPHKIYAGWNKITVYYLGMPVKSDEFYLNHTNNGMNITMYVNATNLSCKCYNLTIVSNSKFNVTNLHPTIPYGKFAVNHTGEVIIQFCNNSPVTVIVTGNDYSYYPPYLYIYGSGNATVTPYYKMKLVSVSALGIPLSVDVKINGTKVTAYGATDKIMPVNIYVVEFPSDVNGFILKNTNLTKTIVNLTTNTELPPAEYKVPTHISLEAYKINATSFKFPFPIPFLPLGHITTKQVEQEAYISGTLLNWYDSPVPNANVTVKIISLKTGYTIEKTVNTGNTGTFDIYFNVTPGVNYSITAVYNGSPVYVGSTEKIVVAGGALPPAPQKGLSISTVMVFALTITIVCAGVAAVAYYAHKKRMTKAMLEMEKKARFFRRVK